MSILTLMIIVSMTTAVAYLLGRGRSRRIAGSLGGLSKLATRPSYYASMVGLWAFIPAVLVVLIWSVFDGPIIASMVKSVLPQEVKVLPDNNMGLVLNQVENIATGMLEIESLGLEYQPAVDRLQKLNIISGKAMPMLTIVVLLLGTLIGYRTVNASHNARYSVERLFTLALFVCSGIAVLSTLGIILSVLFESIRFFGKVPILDFLLGTHWSPQIAIGADQVGASGSFGALPLIVGTLLISFIAMLVAVPTGLMSAIYLSEYASRRARSVIKPLLEVLAGIPTVVYGFFAALTVAPAIRNLGESFRGWGATHDIAWIANLAVSSESALAVGLVMGVMIIPYVSSISDDVINAVPQSLRDASYALGATQSETIKKVIAPAALPGLVSGVLLAVSRAIGETMIVVMAAGLVANMTINPLQAVTTVTAQIVTLLVGDQEFDSAKTLAAFALGLLLLVITLGLNVVALMVVRKYRQKYD